jgi:hypothetical protein
MSDKRRHHPMEPAMPDWTPIFLLPNIRLKHAVGVDEAAMVPPDDNRVLAYCRQYPDFRRFVRKFSDPFGAKSSPGILLLRDTSAPTFRSMEAVSSFRDLVALQRFRCSALSR